jgi:hypothetical protein
MPLPPKNIYRSKEELYTSIQAWATQYNYAFQIGRLNKLNNNRVKVFYTCDCTRSRPLPEHPKIHLYIR